MTAPALVAKTKASVCREMISSMAVHRFRKILDFRRRTHRPYTMVSTAREEANKVRSIDLPTIPDDVCPDLSISSVRTSVRSGSPSARDREVLPGSASFKRPIENHAEQNPARKRDKSKITLRLSPHLLACTYLAINLNMIRKGICKSVYPLIRAAQKNGKSCTLHDRIKMSYACHNVQL